ncbi:TOPRIM and DUF927 domain-containing protein [Thauera aromatica]|uniref:DUF927 domain-containing protein n=1 Tax=Thauera aromatica K172 TaxID=44139 RepID=A0A2R4BJ91_THAAR|nr:DUF927 domain-containing protein [Thauera aromatica]AVR87369.1 hypothetical protein Tharo_0419 [Thauera aromatica K172]
MAFVHGQAKARGWHDDARPVQIDPAEAERRRVERAERDARAAAELEAERAEAAERANAIWGAVSANITDHPYVLRKGGLGFGALVRRGPWPQNDWPDALLTPIFDRDQRLMSVEAISATGEKRSLRGGQKAGGFCAIGRFSDGAAKEVIIAEGIATAAACADATGRPAVAAFCKSNLRAAAEAVRAIRPDIKIVIAADVGAEREARQAAAAVGGYVAAPAGVDGDGSDFWDVWSQRGPDEAGRQLLGVLRGDPVAPEVEGAPAGDAVLADIDSATQGNDPALDPASTTKEHEATPSVSESERPCFRVYDDWVVLDTGRRLRPGVWHHTMSTPKSGEPSPVDSFVCGPLYVLAQTFDGTENNFGRQLRFRTTAGRWRTWAMPMELLKADGADLRGELLAMGLDIDPHARQTLSRYLQDRPPVKRIRCALQVGWCGTSFVLPDAVIGPDASGVIFQSGERAHDEHGQAGTLEGWRNEIAARAVGNPLFVLVLSAAFAGPLLKRTNSEGGGLHFVGDSSTGKTTLLEASCSVWGGPGYKRSWRATANGMEGAASMFNDCLLALDEISECDPREVGAIVYSLGNGTGKQRASRTGSARAVTRWQAVVVSTGERTITTTMADGGFKTKAGQAVRLLDIPAARRFGCFDNLHGLPSGTALSDAIKQAASRHHGKAGRAFLKLLTVDQRDLAVLLEQIKALPVLNPSDAEGQDKRAAGRFALLALAGELATEYGITGWDKGAATAAAVAGFELWRSMRGKGNDERRQILDRLSSFIERHGDSRFSAWTADSAVVRDRAGWWKTDDAGGRLYLFTADGMREALKGYDFKRALDVLEACGVIPKAAGTGERRRSVRIYGVTAKVYEVNYSALQGGADVV